MKRLLDVVLAGFLLLLLSPLLAAVAVAVRRDVGSPVLFRQVRPGLRGRPFTLYKFRTMRGAATGEFSGASDEQRLTRFGAWLRRFDGRRHVDRSGPFEGQRQRHAGTDGERMREVDEHHVVTT